MPPSSSVSPVVAHRVARGLSQTALGQAAGLSRQAVSAIENGRMVPSVDHALAIARALGTTVEVLFASAAAVESVSAERCGELGDRAIVAEVAGRWVAHATAVGDAGLGADGVHAWEGDRAEVELFAPRERVRERVLLAGCAPALGVLSDRLNEASGAGWFRWLARSSEAAIDAVTHEQVHVGGTHFVDPRTGAPDLAAVERRASARGLTLVTLGHWEVGLAVPRGNPRRVRDVRGLAARGARVALREEGSGARRMLEAELRRAGLSTKLLRERGVLTARGHLEVAQAIALGAANVGPTTRDAARSHGLDFVPLARERFDLVLFEANLTEPRIARMLDLLASARFRRELESRGYEASESGQVAATVRAA